MVQRTGAENSRRSEPIFVRATAPGTGGITALILDGKGILTQLEGMLQPARSLKNAAGGLFYSRLVDPHGAPVDEVVLAVISEKDSPTGNPQVELSCHGGEGVLQAVDALLRHAGMMRGRDTELLERAHLNCKLSLISLEARLLLAQAATPRQADFLLGHAALQQRWERIGFDMAMALRTKDESYRPRVILAAREELKKAPAAFKLLKRQHLALCGPVNAGKSTLANCLLRAERHLVSHIPGSTLDRLDTPLSLQGLDVLLSDAAGLRTDASELEQEGQRRARAAAQNADLRLLVIDGSHPPSDSEINLLSVLGQAGPSLLVLNKSDLGVDENARGLGFLLGTEPIVVSAGKGQGLAELEVAIEAQLLGGAPPAPDAPFTARQVQLIKQLADALEQGAYGPDALDYLRRLVGTRPDAAQLSLVLEEKRIGP